MLASACSPILALAGGVGATIGLRHKNRPAIWTGLFGAAVAVRHVAKVTAPHGGFARAFGPDWQSRIPPELQARMLHKRWTPVPQNPPEVLWQRDVVFGAHLETGDPLLADLWQPPDDVPRTGLAVIYLHGSGWHFQDKDTGTRYFFRHLAGQGHMIMDVAYTLAPKAHLQTMVADVKRAIAWMKTNASQYSVNPERVVLMGGSAGGHLALLTAYAPKHPKLHPADVEVDTSVRAAISYYGLADLQTFYEYLQQNYGHVLPGETWLGQRVIAKLKSVWHETNFLPPYGRYIPITDLVLDVLDGPSEKLPDLYRLFSPIHHVGPHCPPTLILQGAHDLGGMAPDARRLHRALCNAGVKSVYNEFPETEHGFDLFLPKWSPAAQAATYDTERFLALMI
jgi:acetyl esterase/lipase